MVALIRFHDIKVALLKQGTTLHPHTLCQNTLCRSNLPLCPCGLLVLQQGLCGLEVVCWTNIHRCETSQGLPCNKPSMHCAHSHVVTMQEPHTSEPSVFEGGARSGLAWHNPPFTCHRCLPQHSYNSPLPSNPSPAAPQCQGKGWVM